MKGVNKGGTRLGEKQRYIGGSLSLNFLCDLQVPSQMSLNLLDLQMAVPWIFAIC